MLRSAPASVGAADRRRGARAGLRWRSFARQLLSVVVSLLAGAGAASAATAPQDTTLRPSASVPRLEATDKVKIDARLDEPLWSRAVRVGDLTQTAPIEGAPMSRRTDVLLTYDSENIYVGIFCHDDPGSVRARQMERDAFVRFDDVVELWFDPFASERFAYWFQVTPGGSLGDALIADNGSSFNKDWDGIWYGSSRVTDEGWVAELAIPVKTLSFDPSAPHWGFNVRRKRVANGERGRWASPRVAYPFFQISDGGRLTGISGLEQGLGLDVIPYVKGLATRESSDRSFGSDFDMGLDLRWRPTPSSTVLVTTNTDFAETEVDTRRVNVGRFPLFFPERRDFFLEDAGAFEFGLPGNRRSTLPFFSRKVGRSDDGAAVPIVAGVKVTGRFGDWTVGALDTYVDSVDPVPASGMDPVVPGVDAQNLGVIRLQRALGDGRSVGLIGTSGDPGGEGGRYTTGVDLRLGSARLFGEGHSGFLWSYLMGSGGADDASGLAYGVQAQSRSSTWETDFRAQRVEEGFDPALGFVRRAGVDRYQGGAERTWRSDDESSLFRTVESGADLIVERDLVGGEDRWSVPLDVARLQFWSQDEVSLRVTRQAETIDSPFDLGNGDVQVAPGDYDETRFRLRFESNDRRIAGLETSVEVGDYYGGSITRMSVEPVYIPNAYVRLGMSFEDVQIELEDGAGDFRTQLYTWRVDLNFDPMTSWNTFLQYDTEGKNLSSQTRLRWIIEPGRELFVVGLMGFDKAFSESSFVTSEQSLALKLNYTLRF